MAFGNRTSPAPGSSDDPCVHRERFELPACTSSVAEARHRVVDRLAAWAWDEEDRDTAALVVTELVTNAVVHTTSETVVCELREGARQIRIAVRDQGCAGLPAIPRGRRPSEAEGGRGLVLVDALSTEWGMNDAGHAPGRIVWAHLAGSSGGER